MIENITSQLTELTGLSADLVQIIYFGICTGLLALGIILIAISRKKSKRSKSYRSNKKYK